MKKVMFALCFMFGGIVVVTAQDTQTQDTTSNQYRTETQSQFPQDVQSQNQSQDMMGQQDRERIQVTELPDEVKRSLEGQEYRGWLISGAFKGHSGQSSDTTNTGVSQQPSNAATGMEDEEIYIVELKNGAETKTVGFKSNGEIVEGVGGDENMQTQPVSPNDQNNDMQHNDMSQPQTSPENNDQSDQSQSSQSATQDQSTSTPSGQSTQNDQSTTTDTQTQTEQSTETQTQTDQSTPNGPR